MVKVRILLVNLRRVCISRQGLTMEYKTMGEVS